MINIKNLDSNKMKLDDNSYKIIFAYHIKYVNFKDLSYITMNSVKPLYLIINKISGCIEKSNWNKYFTLVPNYERKDTVKNYEELWNKVRNSIRSINNNSYENIWKQI